MITREYTFYKKACLEYLFEFSLKVYDLIRDLIRDIIRYLIRDVYTILNNIYYI